MRFACPNCRAIYLVPEPVETIRCKYCQTEVTVSAGGTDRAEQPLVRESGIPFPEITIPDVPAPETAFPEPPPELPDIVVPEPMPDADPVITEKTEKQARLDALDALAAEAAPPVVPGAIHKARVPASPPAKLPPRGAVESDKEEPEEPAQLTPWMYAIPVGAALLLTALAFWFFSGSKGAPEPEAGPAASDTKPIETARTAPPVTPPSQQKAAAVEKSIGLTAAREVELPWVGGGVLLPDGRALVLSLTEQDSLLFFASAAEAELSRATVPFHPTALAAQGDMIFAAAKGVPAVYVLDGRGGNVLKEIKVSGEPIDFLACHPRTGPLFASNASNDVFLIDPKLGTATRTKGVGQLLAVDPVEGSFLFTAVTRVLKNGVPKGGATALLRGGAGSAILKYRITGGALEFVAGTDKAGRHAVALALSADGKQIALASPGGLAGDSGLRHVIPVFRTDNFSATASEVDAGSNVCNIAFHPTLGIAAAIRRDPQEMLLFDSTGRITGRCSLPNPTMTTSLPGVLVFAAGGNKVIWASRPGFGDEGKNSTLHIVRLNP